MDGRGLRYGVWIAVPAEQRAEREVLYHGKLGQHFGVVHLNHPLSRVSV